MEVTEFPPHGWSPATQEAAEAVRNRMTSYSSKVEFFSIDPDETPHHRFAWHAYYATDGSKIEASISDMYCVEPTRYFLPNDKDQTAGTSEPA